MDMVFQENAMNFSSTFELLSKYREEIRTLDIDFLECNYPSSTECGYENNGVCDLDTMMGIGPTYTRPT